MRFHRKRHLHTLQYSVKGTLFYSINKLRRITTQTVTRHEVYKNYDYLQAISNISAKENGKFSSSYSPCEQSFWLFFTSGRLVSRDQRRLLYKFY